MRRIHRRLDNYRQCCGFYIKFFVSLLPYTRAEKSYILDDLHVFMYYMLKFAHNKFAYLSECLDKKECPKKLLKAVEVDYWNLFISSEKYLVLRTETSKGKKLVGDLFMRFRTQELQPYLERIGRGSQEMVTIYNDDISKDCTASFTGKLLEATFILQKISQTKKDKLSDEMNGILSDLGFGQLIEENMEHYELEIDLETYNKNKEAKKTSPNLRTYLRPRSW